eukprot:1114948-Prorocentrum_minimum.AAC.6
MSLSYSSEWWSLSRPSCPPLETRTRRASVCSDATVPSRLREMCSKEAVEPLGKQRAARPAEAQ